MFSHAFMNENIFSQLILFMKVCWRWTVYTSHLDVISSVCAVLEQQLEPLMKLMMFRKLCSPHGGGGFFHLGGDFESDFLIISCSFL